MILLVYYDDEGVLTGLGVASKSDTLSFKNIPGKATFKKKEELVKFVKQFNVAVVMEPDDLERFLKS